MTAYRSSMPAAALGDLAFHILIALGDGPTHGYALGKAIEERSGGRLDPTTGALYQSLKRLADEGLIAQLRRAPESGVDGRRKYFQLTTAGRRAAADEAQRLEQLVAAARQKNLYPHAVRARS